MSGGSASSFSLLTRAILFIGLCAGQATAAEMYGPIQPGEGVYAVARQFRDDQGTLNLRQWTLAIFAANRESFGPGPDTLRAGTRLLIPSQQQVEELWPYGKQLEQGDRYESVATAIDLILQPRQVALAPVLPSSLGATSSPPLAEAANSTYITPVRGEGIYTVAARFHDRRRDLSLHKWAWAIYAANPQAFVEGLDSLRAGSRLRIPSEAQVRELWPLGKQIEQGDMTWTAAARPVATVLTSVPAAVAPEPALSSAAPTPPGELPPPEPYFLWFVPENGAPLPEADTEAEADDTSALDSLDATPQTIGELPGGEPAQGAFAETELYQRALAASGGGNVLTVLAELRAIESRYSGDPDFDYVYGVLLLDAGEPQQAIYPLQRAARQRPGSMGTRLDLGRAYFESGENESARAIFDQLAESNPPPTAALVIASYREAIQRHAGRYERRLLTRLGLSAGNDSNANSATSLTEFAGFFIDDAARSTESSYAQAQLSSELSSPLGPRLSWLLGANLIARQYADAEEFSHNRWALASGLRYRVGDTTFSSTLSGGQTFVDGSQNQNFAALSLGVLQRQSEFWHWRGAAKAGVLRHGDDLEVRDVDQFLLTAGAGRRLSWGYGSEFGLDLAIGRDKAVAEDSPFGRDLIGLTLSGAIHLSPGLRLNLAGHYLEADYDGDFVGTAREDEQLFTDLSLQYTHNRWKNWSILLLSRYVENSSSVELYDYDRLDLGLGLTVLLE